MNNDTLANLAQQIAELETMLSQPLPDVVRQSLEATLSQLQTQQPTILANVNLSDHTQVKGPITGVNQGTIIAIFGNQQPDNAKELLDTYLYTVIERYDRLRMADLVQRAKGRQTKTFSLSQVYITLATDTWVPVKGVAIANRQDAFEQELDRGNPDDVLPQVARRVNVLDGSPVRGQAKSESPCYQLQRPLLLTEAICTHRRMGLLGGPGSGKSTFVRYVAVELARALLAGEEQMDDRLLGWSAGSLLPILVSLGGFAAWTQQKNKSIDNDSLWEYLITESGSGMLLGFDAQIRQAFRRGRVAVFLDGLDEVSDPQLREQVAQAAAELGEQHRGIVVLTCRTWSFTDAVQSHLHGWGPPINVAEFRFGQMQAFIHGWYARSAEPETFDAKEAQQQSEDLIRRLQTSALSSVRDLGKSPLLLTVIVLLHYYEGKLPEDRPELYENLVELLLKNWTQQRRGKGEMPSLLDKLSIGGLKDYHIRSVLEGLAYRAHQGTQSVDGRGLLEEGVVRQAFLDLFTNFELLPGPANEKAQIVLDYLHEESGLLVDEGGNPRTYGLPHLTYEEYLAGCYFAKQKGGKPTNGFDPHEERTLRFEVLAYQHWQADPTRWREVIFLALGHMLQGSDRDIAASWIRFLLETCHGERERDSTERYRAAVFAAECVREVGGKPAFIGAMSVNLRDLWQHLSHTLADLLNDATQPLPVQERIHAGFLLGDLGDPRFPVTPEEWQQEWERAQSGDTSGYFCKVEAGTYRIGGWQEGEQYADIELPMFWIARYEITVEQYAKFVTAGGYDIERWWTPKGWKWNQENDRRLPWEWDNPKFTSRNQPVVGMTWYEATAFAAWTHDQIAPLLPSSYMIRLPTEAEWESAAAYDGPGIHHRFYPWGDDPKPTPERVVFDESGLDRSAPVGCCVAGASACGALDMAGNVWELTMSSSYGYPSKSGVVVDDFSRSDRDVVRRGESFYEKNIRNLSCSIRYDSPPGYGLGGLRLVVSSQCI